MQASIFLAIAVSAFALMTSMSHWKCQAQGTKGGASSNNLLKQLQQMSTAQQQLLFRQVLSSSSHADDQAQRQLTRTSSSFGKNVSSLARSVNIDNSSPSSLRSPGQQSLLMTRLSTPKQARTFNITQDKIPRQETTRSFLPIQERSTFTTSNQNGPQSLQKSSSGRVKSTNTTSVLSSAERFNEGDVNGFAQSDQELNSRLSQSLFDQGEYEEEEHENQKKITASAFDIPLMPFDTPEQQQKQQIDQIEEHQNNITDDESTGLTAASANNKWYIMKPVENNIGLIPSGTELRSNRVVHSTNSSVSKNKNKNKKRKKKKKKKKKKRSNSNRIQQESNRLRIITRSRRRQHAK